MHPYLQVEGPVAMAHRGFSLQGLENTLPAFAAAVDLGLTHVETDVHATRDGALVAFHDASLDRVTDRDGAIAALSWAQVRAATVVGTDGATAAVPLLEDLLGTWPDLRVNIDVKDWPAVGPLVDVVRRTSSLHRVCVTSFDDRRTDAVRRALGEGLATSAGRRGVTRWRLGSLLPGRAGHVAARVRRPGLVALQVPLSAGPLRVVTRRSLAVAHAQGLQVHVWTVDDAARMHQLLDLGVDGLISDRADTLSGVLHQRAAGGMISG
ncbi:MAG TPA: glycerophosphodiester phosphodiesterase [Actinomycetales bacterium]